jgi:hypothetical protein
MPRTTGEQREKLAQALVASNAAWNETLWTYLLADRLECGPDRLEQIRRFCGGRNVDLPPSFDAWVEARPVPARKGTRSNTEGGSRVDLAFGDIGQRPRTEGGIEYAARPGSWVCFVEAKLLSDISTTVAYDPARNQLARVIETLLTFQSAGHFPEKLFFTLLTPRYFTTSAERRRSRLYGYKLEEYQRDASAILRDIRLCEFPERNDGEFKYPASLESRLEALTLSWVTYEDVFSNTPDLRDLDLVEAALRIGRIPEKARERLADLLALEDELPGI